ncbi:MAG: hypothetical protein QOF16_1483, partial [Actinomycetota bacterium]|nr:hypothetical protein [Actinomycetota bacterium]
MAQTADVVEIETQPAHSPRPRRSIKRIALRVVADAMAVSAALFLASAVRFELLTGSPSRTANYTVLTLLSTPIWIMLFWLYGLYEPRQVLGPVNEFKQVFHGVVAGTVVILVYDSIFQADLARGWALIAMLTAFVVVGGERLLVRKVLHFLRRRGGDVTRTIILGANQEARTVARTLEREAWLGYKILGFVDDVAPTGEEIGSDYRVLGSTADLAALIESKRAGLIL